MVRRMIGLDEIHSSFAVRVFCVTNIWETTQNVPIYYHRSCYILPSTPDKCKCVLYYC